MRAVSIIPATTTNLGPGFDTFGLAIQLFNQITIILGSDTKSTSLTDMMRETGEKFFEMIEREFCNFSCEVVADIPQARGLGSSVTIRLGILAGLNIIHSSPLNNDQILSICSSLEGHPDNATAALLGGFTIAKEGKSLSCPVHPDIRFVLLIPDFEIQTAKARTILPANILREDAIKNIQNVAVIATAFAQQKYELLRGVFEDYLHQPYRSTLLPFFNQLSILGENAGAFGAWISGSGSTVCWITENLQVANRVVHKLEQNIPSTYKLLIVVANNQGIQTSL